MNTRVIFALFLLVVSSSLVGASTNDAVRSVQQGLFEEEANHQLEAAIRNYQEALENVNSNRQVVAVNIFERLLVVSNGRLKLMISFLFEKALLHRSHGIVG